MITNKTNKTRKWTIFFLHISKLKADVVNNYRQHCLFTTFHHFNDFLFICSCFGYLHYVRSIFVGNSLPKQTSIQTHCIRANLFHICHLLWWNANGKCMQMCHHHKDELVMNQLGLFFQPQDSLFPYLYWLLKNVVILIVINKVNDGKV